MKNFLFQTLTPQLGLLHQVGIVTVRNRFVVDGKFPGVETFFSANIDDEIDHLFEFVSDRVSPAE